jgi:hypothetical protein
MLNGVFHRAKIGDIIYSLPAVYLRGGTNCYKIKREEVCEYLKPLLEAQPYIDKVIQSPNGYDCELDFSNYQALYKLYLRGNLTYMHLLCAGIRTHHFPLKISSLKFQSKHLSYGNKEIDLDTHRDIPIWNDEKPWLTNIEAIHKTDIVINFTERYHDFDTHNVKKHNFMFFDYTLCKNYDCGFIGLNKEYDLFVDRYKFKPKRIKVKNALETAQIIKGSKVFVGSASSAKAIAEGLKHPTLTEISKKYPDDLPMHKNGHYFISKELLDYYMNYNKAPAKFPIIKKKKQK